MNVPNYIELHGLISSNNMEILKYYIMIIQSEINLNLSYLEIWNSRIYSKVLHSQQAISAKSRIFWSVGSLSYIMAIAIFSILNFLYTYGVF